MLDKHAGKPLPAALWSSQRDVYGADLRRPYVAAGVYPQRLRIKRQDVIGRTIRAFPARFRMEEGIASIDPNDSDKLKTVRENVAYYERELAHFRNSREGTRLTLKLTLGMPCLGASGTTGSKIRCLLICMRETTIYSSYIICNL